MKAVKVFLSTVALALTVVITASVAQRVGFDKGVDVGEKKGKEYVLFFLSSQMPITMFADTSKGSQGWRNGTIQIESKEQLGVSLNLYIDFSLSPVYWDGRQYLHTKISKR